MLTAPARAAASAAFWASRRPTHMIPMSMTRPEKTVRTARPMATCNRIAPRSESRLEIACAACLVIVDARWTRANLLTIFPEARPPPRHHPAADHRYRRRAGESARALSEAGALHPDPGDERAAA